MPSHIVRPISLDNVPNEILEHIAFFSGSISPLGPPSALPILLTLNRNINTVLAPSRNPHVYARIFAAKFDTSALVRRFGAAEISAQALAGLLRERCVVLKRVHAKSDCLRLDLSVDEPERGKEDGMLDEILMTCYKMMLENDGKNEQQLRHAGLDEWLRLYWFDPEGASFSIMALRTGRWPASDDRLALAMWLFWFIVEPNTMIFDNDKLRSAMSVIKPYALGAHKYHISRHPWIYFTSPRPKSNFLQPQHSDPSNNPLSLSTYRLAPLPLAVPAILCYFGLAGGRMHAVAGGDPFELLGTHFSVALASNRLGGWGPVPPVPFHAGGSGRGTVNEGGRVALPSVRWDAEWARCISQERAEGGVRAGEGEDEGRKYGPCVAIKPGCLEGVWEGHFTYTEFTTYAALLEGAPPPALQSSLIAQHRQTWKLREHHLLADIPPFTSASSFSTEHASPSNASKFSPASPLPNGDPLRGFIPPDVTISETSEGLDIRLPESDINSPAQTVHYTHFSPSHVAQHERQNAEGGIDYSSRVRDIIVTGEGHSSWGEFSLVGRVRPYDGLVSVSKEYVNGDRGRWLYKGYLVGVGTHNGMQAGHMVGRWRDTLTPFEVRGYEGCFGMCRRQ